MKTLVLPEGSDTRVLSAARHLQDQGLARVRLLGEQARLETIAAGIDLSLAGLELIDPVANPRLDEYVAQYRKQRVRTNDKVARRLLSRPLFHAGMMVKSGEAHAMLAGAACTTAKVIEASLMTVGLAEGIETPSSAFVMVLPRFRDQEQQRILFADCAVNVDPNPAQLADIALASARTYAGLVADEPRIAFLSFSSRGSGRHASIDKVVDAVAIARERAPSLAIDGELQADTALIDQVARIKLTEPGPVAGRANVLIFPDLNSGNIAYKLTQYLAGAQAIGPILQGFAKPVSDLSRGATVEDIIATAIVTLAQVSD